MMLRPFIAAASAVVLTTLAGCELFKTNPETLGTVNRRVTGMPAGDFFDRYGRPGTRSETADGGAVYSWESPGAYARPGFAGVDEKICRLSLTADRRGRITGATIVFDAPGHTGLSRCREIFAAA